MDRKAVALLFVLLFASTSQAQWYDESGHPKNEAQPGNTYRHAMLTTVASSVLDMTDCPRWSSIQKNGDTSMTVAVYRCYTTNPATCAVDSAISDLSAAAYDYAYVFGQLMQAVPTDATVEEVKVICIGEEQ